MATVPRQGRKGGKLTSSPSVAPREATPGTAMSPASLLMGGEGTTIISDPNAAHPFDPDAIQVPAKKPVTNETNVLQFDVDAIQHISKGVMVGRTKQVRTTTRAPQAKKWDVVSKLQAALRDPEESISCPSHTALKMFDENHVVVTHRPQDVLTLAVALINDSEKAKVLIVVPKYFEVSAVKTYLESLDTSNGKLSVGELHGQTFSGDESTRIWVTSAEIALLYLMRIHKMDPFTHIFVPGFSSKTQLLSCFVNMLIRWLLSNSPNSRTLRLVIAREQNDPVETVRRFSGLKVAFVEVEASEVTKFSYGEACALVDKEMVEMDTDRSGKFPPPTKRLIEHTAQVAAEVVRSILNFSKSSQVIVVFTAEVRDILAALESVHIEDCVVYSGFKSTEETASAKHRVHVMNHVRYDFGSDNEYTVVLDMGTIRRATAQHKSESFMAASTIEWESQLELAERLEFLAGKKNHFYFALYPENVATSFIEKPQILLDEFATEDAFVQCARLNISLSEASCLLPAISAETADHVIQNLAEKSTIANPQSLAITFIGEIAARLPVDLDIATFIINGCAIGLGEATIAIASVMALPFRTATPLTYSWTQWSECTEQSREKYGCGDVARQSDLLADTLVFLEWLKMRVQGASTSAFLDEILVQEFKLQRIEGLMNYIREQLSDYVFLDPFDSLTALNNITRSVKDNVTMLLIVQAVSLARRAAFIREAGHLNEKERFATMAFVRTSKHLVPHSFIPSSVKWSSGRILVPVLLTNSTTNILAGIFSLIHTPYFFTSLLLLYPQVEYSKPVVTDKGRVVYFGVSCNRQMKRMAVSIEEAAQILDFRERWNIALGCMQALRTMNRPVSRTKYGLALKEHDRLFDMDKLLKDIRRQLVDLVTELGVVEHQGTFETFSSHCIAPKEILPMSDALASDVTMLHSFADGTLWDRRSSPHSATLPRAQMKNDQTPAPTAASVPYMDDDDDDVEFIQESFFVRHGPLIEDDD